MLFFIFTVQSFNVGIFNAGFPKEVEIGLKLSYYSFNSACISFGNVCVKARGSNFILPVSFGEFAHENGAV